MEFTKTVWVLNELHVLLTTEARLQSTSACIPLVQAEASGSVVLVKRLRANVSVSELLLYFHLCAYAVLGFAYLIRLTDGKTEYSEKLFALLPRHHSALHGCNFAGASMTLGIFSSVPGVSLNPGLLKGISPHSSVFRQVSETQIQGRMKDVFKASKKFMG